MDAKTNTAREPPAPRSRASRNGRRVTIALATLALAVAALFALVASETALTIVARIAVARSEGRLEVDAPSGSLLSAVRVKRLVWRGPGATMTADEVAINWNPLTLFSPEIVIKGLGAQRITLAIEPSDSAIPPPPTLALPMRVAIGEVAVANLDWTIGKNDGRITGVTFGYAGGPAAHRIERTSLVLPSGKLTGSATLDAQPPFAINGAFAFDGDVEQKRARADIAVSGKLEAVGVEATGRAGEAGFALHARLTPLAAIAVDQLALDAHDLDLAAWDARLPMTRLDVQAEGRPASGGIAGSLAATNAIAGPIDANRLPVRSVSTRFAWRADEVVLDDFVAELTRDGRVAGRAQVPLGGGAGKWMVEVRDVDLRQLHSTLATTRLSGSLGADLDTQRQRLEGRVADRSIVGGIGASFAATLVDRRLSIERFQIRAGDGELAGRGAIEFSGRRAFDVTAKARRVDPSRFGKFPAGRVDGDVVANGALDPSWQVTAKATIAAGSQLTGVPVSGSLHASFAPHTVRDAAVDAKLGSAHLTASGSMGGGTSALTLALDAPRIAELAPLLPARVPRPLSGALRVNATTRGDLDSGGLELQAHGEALKAGAALAVGSFDARVSVAPAATTGTAFARPSAAAGATPTKLDERRVQIEIAATNLVGPPGTFPRARASVEGTLAEHRAKLALTAEDLDIDAAAHGGIRESPSAGAVAWTWVGSLDALDNRGPWALHLAAPATVEIARDHVRIGAARLRIADGNVDVADLAWDDGRITTRGSFAAVPVATLAKLGGVKLPFATTLTLGGDWSLAATPRLNGSMTVRRERGDVFFGSEPGGESDDRAFRITAASLSARFVDDAVEATATVRSEHGLNADAQLAIGVAPNAPPGRFSADAPLSAALNADLATLKVLQPWTGTMAVVDGNAHAELVARGTLARAPLTGTVRAGGIRVAAPQYGLLFSDGRLDARLADGTIMLDELSLVGGAGKFVASGTLATTGSVRSAEDAAAQMTWRAEKFRVLNRPDLRLVVGGSGKVTLKNRKISLEGKLTADEGHFEYEPDVGATLGDDVVVKGWQTNEPGEARRANLPLSVDLELDLGTHLTFVGEGLETGLRGEVHVTTGEDGRLRGRGSIRTVNGTYHAFGQKLVIDRGRLIFDGPLDNPGLDIVALRKNLAVEAGVAISGTVKVPIIQLTSNPPVPDNEKLSWLVLGQGLERNSGADVAALQAASAALLGRGGKSVTSTFAESVGLDDVTVGTRAGASRAATGGSPEAAGQVVAFGKRITDRLTLVYEQGLTVASNALRLEYRLSRTLTLRAEAGTISSFGIYSRRVFD
jgi:translocation and assembly module TamB